MAIVITPEERAAWLAAAEAAGLSPEDDRDALVDSSAPIHRHRSQNRHHDTVFFLGRAIRRGLDGPGFDHAVRDIFN